MVCAALPAPAGCQTVQSERQQERACVCVCCVCASTSFCSLCLSQCRLGLTGCAFFCRSSSNFGICSALLRVVKIMIYVWYVCVWGWENVEDNDDDDVDDSGSHYVSQQECGKRLPLQTIFQLPLALRCGSSFTHTHTGTHSHTPTDKHTVAT